MMKTKTAILTFIFLFVFIAGSSQTKREADSLSGIILSGADSSKVSAYDEFSRLSCGTDISKAREFAFKALHLAKKNKNPKFIASSLNRLGSVYDYDNRPDSANYYFLGSLKIYEELNDYHGKGNVFQNLAVMYYYQQDFPNAHKYNLQSIECRQKTGEEKFIAQIYNNMGAMLRQEKKYDQALEMYNKALAIKIKFNDKKSLSATYQNVATVYAIKKEFKRAFDFVEKAITMDLELGNNDDLAKSYLTKADIFNLIGDNVSARNLLDLSIHTAEKTGNTDQLYKAYEMRSLLDTAMGDYKSGARDMHLSNLYKAKVFKKEKAGAIEKLKVVYETEKKDNEIALLNLENENKANRQSSLYMVIALTGLLLLISLFFYNKKRKDNLLLALQKKEIVEKTEILNLQAAEIARHRSQMNPHFIFNALNSLQGNILKKDNEKSLTQLAILSKLMRATLNNSDKEWISLTEEIDYLSQYTQFEKQRLDFDFSFKIQIDSGIDPENTGIPAMLIQPLIENSIKHAQLHLIKYPEIKFHIAKKDRLLLISLKDNGKGRSGEFNKVHNSKALSILEKRIKEINLKGGISPGSQFVINDLKNGNDLQTGTECVIKLHYFELL